jgi:two-component SAPR family response regulator
VVDDEEHCLEELIYLLSREQNVEIVGAFTNPLEALTASAALKPDVAFLDLSMPHLGGAELARKMQACCPDLKVVFITSYAKELEKIKAAPSNGSILKPVSKPKLYNLLKGLS